MEQHDTYALIDSGAPVSLLSYDEYNKIDEKFKSPLSMPSVALKSVTGQSLDVVGATSVTFFISEKLRVVHEFQVVKNLQPYEAILGLDFLAHPSHEIRHELPNFVLCFQQTPIRLFNSDRHRPCATVLPVKAKGRHQYVGPRAVTFIRAQITGNMETATGGGQGPRVSSPLSAGRCASTNALFV